MRDLTIDISKCLGIFLVVLGHCLHNDSAAHDVIYLFHMPLFFFLSGFFFREQDLLLFFRNKTKRLLYPFVFLLCVCQNLGHNTLYYSTATIANF